MVVTPAAGRPMPTPVTGDGHGAAGAPRAREPGRDEAEHAARAFAALLLAEVLKAALPAGGSAGAGGGLFRAGVEGEVYRDAFVQTLAERIAAAPGFALTRLLAEQLDPHRSGPGGDGGGRA